MDIYKLNNKRLDSVETVNFDLEKEIQSIVENNSEELFNLTFIKSEVSCGNYRFDSLCWNEEDKSFVIIEYKKKKSSSISDQGMAYLSTLLKNQSFFVLEYNENMNGNIKRKEVDWSQSRVIFISTFFNEIQKDSVNFKDVPFELWEIKKYSNKTISLNQIVSNSNQSIKTFGKTSSLIKEVSEEIIKYDEKSVISIYPKEYIDIYESLKEKILNFGDIIIKVKKTRYLSFCLGKRVIFYIYLKKKYMLLEFLFRQGLKGKWKNSSPPFKFKDPEKKFYQWEDEYRESYRHKLTTKSDVDYVIYCLKQKYDSMK